VLCVLPHVAISVQILQVPKSGMSVLSACLLTGVALSSVAVELLQCRSAAVYSTQRHRQCRVHLYVLDPLCPLCFKRVHAAYMHWLFTEQFMLCIRRYAVHACT
jgi:hypothetical protein